MKKLHLVILCLSLICIFLPHNVAGKGLMEKADKVFEQGGYEDPQKFLKALNLYKKALNKNPKSYELNWKAARACMEYAKYSKRNDLDNWKDISAKYGKKGMQYAKRAINIEPDKIQGHFFYALNVGRYSTGVSFLTAIAEGLKNKTQRHLRRAYEINKKYKDATPVLALGRYWQILPLWFDDPDRALELYQEADSLMPKDSDYRPTLQVYMGKLLLEQGINESRAKSMLKKAKKSEDPWLSKRAKKILEKY